MRYSTERLDIKVAISGNVLLFKDIKFSLGLLITARKMHDVFRENCYSRHQQLQIIELESLLSNPKFEANRSA